MSVAVCSPVVSLLLLAAVLHREADGVAVLIDCKWQVWYNFPSLHPFQPLDGPLVAFLAYFHPHLLRCGCSHVVDGNVAGVHHHESIAVGSCRAEYRSCVILRAEIAGYLFDGLRFGVSSVLLADLRYHLKCLVSNDHPVIFICDKHKPTMLCITHFFRYLLSLYLV